MAVTLSYDGPETKDARAERQTWNLCPGACRPQAAGDFRGQASIFDVRPGFYVYVGSALGPGGLAARIGRHARQEKAFRWHVVYLRAVTDLVEVWFSPGVQRRECLWAERLARTPGAGTPMLGFGASDCGCRSHLFWFEERPVPMNAEIEAWRSAWRRP